MPIQGLGVIFPPQIFAGANITLSTSGGSTTIIGPAAGGGIAISAPGNSVSNGTVVWANGNNVTFGMAGSTITASASFPAQTEQTQNRFNLTLSGNTDGVMAHVSSGTLTLAGGNNVTLSQAGNAITISAANQTLQTQSRFNLTLAGNSTSAGAGYILISSGVMTLAGGDNVTLSQNGNAVTIIGPSPGAGGGIAASAAGNSVSGGTVVWSNSNNVSFGMAGSTITATATFAQSVQTQNLVTLNGSTGDLTLVAGNLMSISNNARTISVINLLSSSNIANDVTTVSGAGTLSSRYALADHQHRGVRAIVVNGANGTATMFGDVVVAAGNNITLSTGASSFSIHGATAAGGAVINRQYHEIIDGERLTTVAAITGASYSKRPIFVPFWMDGEGLSVKTINFLGSRGTGTSLNMTYGVGFYSMVNSTQLTLVSSTTNAISCTTSAQWSGIRRYEITGLSALTLSEGRWIAALYFSGSNNSTAVANLLLVGGESMLGVNGYVFPGTNSTGATSGSEHIVPFWGVYASTTAGFPGSVHRSEISGQGSNNVNADVYMVIREI